MSSRSVGPVSSRLKADTWASPFPKQAVLVGDSAFIQDAEAYFAAHVRDMALRTITTDHDGDIALPPGFPIQGPWCLIVDLVTSQRSLRIARKILLNTSNVPFIALAGDVADIPEIELRSLLELGITHVLPLPESWSDAWTEIKKILARRLNPLLSVHSTKMWLVGVLQSVATEERNCCVRISSRGTGKSRTDHGTSLRVSPVGLLGEIYFHEGQPIYAWSTRLQGDEAIIDLLQTSNVQISVLDSGWVPPTKNVQSPLQGVLLEFMRRKDLGQLEPPSGVLSIDGDVPAGPSTKHIPVPAVAAPSARIRKLLPLLGALIASGLVLFLTILLRTPTPTPAPAPPPSAPAPAAKAPPPPPVEAPPPPASPAAKAPALRELPPTPAKPKEPPRDLKIDLGAGATLDLVLLPAGRFTMGSPDDELGRERDEGPLREVVFRAPLYMGKYEVTQEQYEAVMGQNPSQFKGPRRPVESVSSFEAQEFCERAGRRAGRELRLPTEAEWEYGCRAGSTRAFSGGAALSSATANFDGRMGYGGAADGSYRGKTLEVGSLAPNAWGLYDMHGNVGEWCLDFYDSRAYDSASSAPPGFSPSRPDRVWRGGAFNDPPRRCRSANREHYNPGGRDSNRGFRVVMAIESTPPPADPH
jgi:formylglycine-generating enzyme required for sulfatase activity